jgi:hypothetical protein
MWTGLDGPCRGLGSTAAIHDTEDVRRRLARLVSCYTSAYRTLRKRDVPLAAVHTRVVRTEPG